MVNVTFASPDAFLGFLRIFVSPPFPRIGPLVLIDSGPANIPFTLKLASIRQIHLNRLDKPALTDFTEGRLFRFRQLFISLGHHAY